MMKMKMETELKVKNENKNETGFICLQYFVYLEIATEDEVVKDDINEEIERPFSKLPEFSTQITSLNAMRP